MRLWSLHPRYLDPKGLVGDRALDYAVIFANPDLCDPSRPVGTDPAGEPSTRVRIRSTLDSRSFDDFGLPLRRYVDGPVAIEAETVHDVKAVEYHLKKHLAQVLAGRGEEQVARTTELVHFACTSEDVNNLAYALMIQGSVQQVWLRAGALHQLCAELAEGSLVQRRARRKLCGEVDQLEQGVVIGLVGEGPGLEVGAPRPSSITRR